MEIVNVWASIADFLNGDGLPIVHLGLQWVHSPETIWLSAHDTYEYLGEWYISMLIDFLNSSYAIDKEGHGDLIYYALGQSEF